MTNQQTNFIIFSKDRACQLHACLESLFKFFKSKDQPTVTVIYKTSNEEFDKGYEKLKDFFPPGDDFNWEKERNFKAQTIKAVNGFPWVQSQYTVFLVDDIIFVNPVSTEDKQFSLIKNNSMMVGISMRLHNEAIHCYASNEPQKIPNFVKGMVWPWTEYSGDWGYPLSVDGNVYNTEFIKTFVETLDYSNPNTFEAKLDMVKNQPNVPSYLCCYVEAPRLINIPANRVQQTFNNRYAKGYSAVELNSLYLQGNTIDISLYEGMKPNSVHVPVEIKFKKRLEK